MKSTILKVLCSTTLNMPPSRSRSRSPSPYSRRMAISNHREDRTRSRSPPRKPVYSPSPPRRHRSRSRSPRRRHDDRPRKSGGGFRWKEKPRYEDDDRDRRDERRLDRGYRDQERERPRQRSVDRRDSGRRERDFDIEKKFGKEKDLEDKFGKRDEGAGTKNGDKPPEKPRKEKKSAPVATTGEPMIVVNVNDRLGTKASIPCMASDPISISHLSSSARVYSWQRAQRLTWSTSIGLFKAQVAAVIGRQPHEIMLKRQGERPFKDQLTLEDYGVSNGVQLDL